MAEPEEAQTIPELCRLLEEAIEGHVETAKVRRVHRGEPVSPAFAAYIDGLEEAGRKIAALCDPDQAMYPSIMTGRSLKAVSGDTLRYEDEMEAQRQFDRATAGGGPDDTYEIESWTGNNWHETNTQVRTDILYNRLLYILTHHGKVLSVRRE